jgi:chaperonin GroEL
VIITKDNTTIVGGNYNPKHLKAHVQHIEQQILHTTQAHDKEQLEMRKAKLTDGIGVIHVGAHTETEMQQKKHIFEDALAATKAALKEGILPGGGMAYIRAAQKINLSLEKEEEIGKNIFIQACHAPFKYITQNAGKDSAVLLETIRQSLYHQGYNVLTEDTEDMIKTGIIDPATIVKNSMIHAVSTAGIVLLSEAIISDAKNT